MRVLLINNHHKIVGGTERYYFDLAKLLESKGHKVAFFSTKDRDNKKTYWEKYFIKKNNFKDKSLNNFIKLFPNMFYSFEAKENISKLLDEFKPDIVHIQNIYYYITPSIFSEIKKRRIPIVQTIHDYQLISPNVNMFHSGSICQITKVDKFYKAIFHRCVKGSYLATFMSVVCLYMQNAGHYYEKSVKVFITPSKYMKRKLEEYRFAKGKISVLNNFLYGFSNKKFNGKNKSNYILYFGRLNQAKGIFLLLNVAKMLSYINIKLVGEFEDSEIKRLALDFIEENKIGNVQILPFVDKNKLSKLIKNSRFIITPSLWFENQPYSILESFALGKPVIASKIGGIPEIVLDKKNGYLFKPNDFNDLMNKILKFWNNPKLANKLGEVAKKYVLADFSPDKHYNKLINIYEGLVNKART